MPVCLDGPASLEPRDGKTHCRAGLEMRDETPALALLLGARLRQMLASF